jgi:hypothetical protein
MSDVSFPISVPPIPTPNVSPDEGVPGIPEAWVYSNGSYGNSSIGLDAPEAFTPQQIGNNEFDESKFPFEVNVKVNRDRQLEVKVASSVVYDFTASAKTPLEVSVDELTSTLTAAGTYYVYLTLTLDLDLGKEVTTAELSLDDEPPGSEGNKVFIEIAEIEVTRVNGVWGIEELIQHTTGAIFYPIVNAWSQYSPGLYQLQIGRDPLTTTATAENSSVLDKLKMFVNGLFNLEVKDSGGNDELILGTEVGENNQFGAFFKTRSDASISMGDYAAEDGSTDGGWINLFGESSHIQKQTPTKTVYEDGSGNEKTIIGSKVGAELTSGAKFDFVGGSVGIGSFSNASDDSGYISCIGTSGNSIELTHQLVDIRKDGSSVVSVHGSDVDPGKLIAVRTVTKADGTSLQALATEDFSLSGDVGWANYSSGDLEIGGSNTDGVADLNIDFSGVLTMTGGTDFSFVANTAAELSTMRMGSARVNEQDVGDFVSGNPSGSYCAMNNTGISTTNSSGNPLITIDSSDIPETATLPAKFREVQLCNNNNVAATAYIIMTEPVDDD